jgi:DNA gyrase subunit A
MSVIRAAQVAAEAALDSEAADVDVPDVKPQFVFTMTDGGFAKRTRITDYRQQSRGGIGIKTMSLANEDRGVLVGAFIVVEGDEILSITQGGQVVRSPINADFRATGRDTMGVKFVTPKGGDAVAVVARSVESPEEVLEEASVGATVSEEQADESPDVGPDATIESGTSSPEEASGSDEGPASH